MDSSVDAADFAKKRISHVAGFSLNGKTWRFATPETKGPIICEALLTHRYKNLGGLHAMIKEYLVLLAKHLARLVELLDASDREPGAEELREAPDFVVRLDQSLQDLHQQTLHPRFDLDRNAVEKQLESILVEMTSFTRLISKGLLLTPTRSCRGSFHEGKFRGLCVEMSRLEVEKLTLAPVASTALVYSEYMLADEFCAARETRTQNIIPLEEGCCSELRSLGLFDRFDGDNCPISPNGHTPSISRPAGRALMVAPEGAIPFCALSSSRDPMSAGVYLGNCRVDADGAASSGNGNVLLPLADLPTLDSEWWSVERALLISIAAALALITSVCLARCCCCRPNQALCCCGPARLEPLRPFPERDPEVDRAARAGRGRSGSKRSGWSTFLPLIHFSSNPTEGFDENRFETIDRV